MGDEPRRSGRPNKGHHSKDRDISGEPAPAKGKKGKVKGKGKAKETPEEPEEDDEAIIRCICGAVEDDEGLMMIACDDCTAWQHNLCMNVTEDESSLPEQYLCERCKPEQHKELLAAIAKGQKPWVAKKKTREREESERKRKKSTKGKGGKGGRQSKAADVSSTPGGGTPQAEQSPKSEPDNKRKRGENGFKIELVTATQEGAAAEHAEETPQQQKRRKASHAAASTDQRQSAAQRKDSTSDPLAVTVSEGTGPRLKTGNALIKSMEEIIKAAVKDGWFRIPDGHTASSLGSQFGKNIEMALAAELDLPAYSLQFRKIHANMKKNMKLFSQLLIGKLSTDDLVHMTSDEMATEELQQEMAEKKAAADKQVVLERDDGPRIRKTHKGEEVVDDADVAQRPDDTFRPVRQRPTDEVEENQDAGGADEAERVELPEDIGRRPLTLQTLPGAAPSHPGHGSSSKFDIDQVWSSVHSPDAPDFVRPMQQPPRRRSSAMNLAGGDAPPHSAIVDTDVDRLLRDDDPANFVSGVRDSAAVWEGQFHMGNIDFHTSVKWVAGGDPARTIPWPQLLPPVIDVTGRIQADVTDNYIQNMSSQPQAEVSVLSVLQSSSSQDAAGFDNLFHYLTSRDRWGVLDTHHHVSVKDMYLIPLHAGSAELPGFMQILVDNIVEGVRKTNMLLLVMVVKSTGPPVSADATPSLATTDGVPAQTSTPAKSFNSGPVSQQPFSPVLPQGPVDNAGALTANAQIPTLPPLAASILADFLHTPTVNLMLGAIPDMSEEQLLNLREILTTVPETRGNVSALSAHLQERNAAG